MTARAMVELARTIGRDEKEGGSLWVNQRPPLCHKLAKSTILTSASGQVREATADCGARERAPSVGPAPAPQLRRARRQQPEREEARAVAAGAGWACQPERGR